MSDQYAEGLGVDGGRGEGLRVDVVDADEVVLDEDFALFGFGDWEVGLVLQDLCSSSLFHQYPLHGLWDLGRGCHGSGPLDVTGIEGESGYWVAQLAGDLFQDQVWLERHAMKHQLIDTTIVSSRFENSRISSLRLRRSSAPHQGSEGPDSSANRPICSTSIKLSGNVMRLMTGPCPQSCCRAIVLGVLPSPKKDTSGQPTHTPYAPGDKVHLLRVQGSTHNSGLACEDRARAPTSVLQDFWLCFIRYVPKHPRKLSTEAKPYQLDVVSR